MSTGQHSLFAAPEPAPAEISAPRPERFADWRAPTPGEHACDHPGCGSATGFGLGDKWICRGHLPADYFPAVRLGRAS